MIHLMEESKVQNVDEDVERSEFICTQSVQFSDEVIGGSCQ